MTATHHTAWITTDTSALPGDNIDITVLADEIATYQGDEQTPVYQSTGDPVFYAETGISARDDQPDDLTRQAEKTLRGSGWSVVGDWEGIDTGYVATVERA